ncbi:tetraacyldisaccharide 4'-kinase [Hanstruepera marina]|uniref:tetraacyldisaccharide 4'-kinase n=1 Tax=Hanstruepera marina TaxID=2873265 RepID=UPI001CA71ECF|nr:tetraacyldisaccharide 4'-kinase [Hanstruepera marina]
MKLIRILLFPIVPIYFLVTWLRNRLYDVGMYTSKSYDFPLIAVGNLSTGGTGKTPMVEYLIRLMKNDRKVATLSRGYGRKTKGFLLANDEATADSIGDEPFQFYNKFNEDVQIAVCEDRQNGIATLRLQESQPEVIILDDAYQHRKVKAGFYVLLTSYGKLYANDIVLPTGNLREPRSGAKRAQVIVVTKCPPDLSETQKQQIRNKLNPLPHQKLYFSSIEYSYKVYSETEESMLTDLKDFTLITGIANPQPLVDYLERLKMTFEHLKFGDHHHFTATEIEEFEKLDCILTTEKDFMRLKMHPTLKQKLFYLPITIQIDQADDFNKQIMDFIAS